MAKKENRGRTSVQYGVFGSAAAKPEGRDRGIMLSNPAMHTAIDGMNQRISPVIDYDGLELG